MRAPGSANAWPQGPLLADGAMGTLLFSRGIPQRAALDELVLSRPELIGAIHREYLAAGADLIETATFGANRVRLAPYGLADQAGRLARRGAQIAREARDVAGRDVLVAGSVGPLGAPTNDLVHLGDADGPGRVPRGHRRPARGRRRPVHARDLLVARPPRDRDRGGAAGRGRPADRRAADVRRGDRAAGRHDAGVGGGRARRLRRRRDRRQLRGRPAGLPRRAHRDGRPRRRRSCRTPGSRSASRASSSTPRAPTTSAGWSATCWTPGRGSSAAAAGPRPSTSPRCARRSTPGPPWRRAEPAATAERGDRARPDPAAHDRGDRRRPARCRAAADRARPGARGRPVRGLGRDRPAALGPHRPDDRGRPAAQGRRRRHRQRQRLGDGPRPDGRAGRRVRDPARPGPRVRRPHDDPRPEPHGPRVRAARARTRSGCGTSWP